MPSFKLEHEHAVLAAVGLDRVEVDECRAMDAHELLGREPLLELLERVVDQVLVAVRAREHQAVAREHHRNLIQLEQLDLAPMAHRQSPQRRHALEHRRRGERLLLGLRAAGALAAAHLRGDAAHRFVEALAAHRLEQVIERGDLERLDGVAVVGGDEHDDRRVVAAEMARDLETGEVGHVDVEERDVGLVLRGERQRLGAVAGHGDDLDPFVLAQQLLEELAGAGLVVRDQRAHASDARSAGDAFPAGRPAAPLG